MFRTHSVVAIIFLFTPSLLSALTTDHSQKIFITADSSTYNSKTGLAIFIGHVKVDQGTTHIIADKLTAQTDLSHQIHEITAYGLKDVAHYWTKLTNSEPEVRASANIIKFYPKQFNVTFEQNVHITQGKNSFHGRLIVYNRNEETIIVPASEKGQAELIYNPDNKL